MRILITADPELPVPPPLYGGIERVVDLLVTELVRTGHDVALVAHPDSTCPASAFFPWPGRHSQQPFDTMRNTVALARAVASFRPDVLHSFSRLMYMAPLFATRLPKIMSYQRHPGARQVAWASRLAGRSLLFTGCSRFLADSGRRFGGTWETVHNFVDTNRYHYQPDGEPDAPLVFLSRVEDLKGAHVAIAVARAVNRRLVIAGNHADDGPQYEYWRTKVLPFIDGDAVEYVGPVGDEGKDALLGRAKALFVPIQWDEPFGIVFAESLACGTPVLSTPRGAVPEIVRHGIDGFLSATIVEMEEHVQAVGSIRRSDCRERVEERFSVPVVVAQYAQLYAKHAAAQFSGSTLESVR